MKKYINKNTIIIFILLVLGGSYVYLQMLRKIPLNPPKTLIKYNDKSIPTSIGDCSWVPTSGGSSNETGGEYNVGLNTPRFNAKSGDKIHISIPQNPLDVRIDLMLDNNYNHEEYTPSKEGKEYTFILPTEKGEYIFKVFANWDSNIHNTATIFQVTIE